MYLLGLDFETSGLDPEKDRVIEIGASLWDVERKKTVLILNHLVNAEVSLTDEITKVTGITEHEIKTFGVSPFKAFSDLINLYGNADAIVAHNGTEFDKKFFVKEYARLGVEVDMTKPWIDTTTDIDFPEEMTHRNLTYLSATHGFINPFPHRAFSDALSMLKILSNYEINDVLAASKMPVVTLKAEVSFDDKDKAKRLKYQWDAQRKQWLKKVKEHKVVHETRLAEKEGFRTTILGGTL